MHMAQLVVGVDREARGMRGYWKQRVKSLVGGANTMGTWQTYVNPKPKPQTYNPKPQTYNPKRQTYNPKPETYKPKPQTLLSKTLELQTQIQ